MMRYLVILFVVAIASCTEKEKKSKLMVTGEIKNAGNQKAYLEEVYFIQKPPLIIDTAEINNGKFQLQAIAAEQGLYRVRLEGGQQFFFINDELAISLSLDANDSSMATHQVNTPANRLLFNFIRWMENTGKEINAINGQLRERLATNPNDSTAQALQQQMIAKMNSGMQYLQKFVDTVSNPVVAMFALGYLDNGDNSKTNNALASLKKRFPSHKAIEELEEQLKNPPVQAPVTNTPAIGTIAPDISMNDTEGKLFSLSSLRGKYVLVDFWASWCGPCRDENPNVVMAYNKFKNKNFTVLGVSLDKQKEPWLSAIKEDGLAWKQISDLKYWDSEAVKLYGFQGIPYNVLLDPEGKIIASDLRGEMLEQTLTQLVK